LRTTKEILVCCALIALVAFLLQGALLLQDCRATTQASTKTLQGIDLMRVTIQAQVAGKNGLLSEATAMAREGRKTIDVVQKTSLAERAKVAAFSDASIRAVNDLDAVERDAVATVRALQEAVAELGGTATALTADAEAAKPTIVAATALLASVDKGSSLALDRTSQAIWNLDGKIQAITPIESDFQDAVKHIDGSAAELEQSLGYVRDSLKPTKRSFWESALDHVTGGLFGVWLHWVPQRVSEVK
jgi:hypothetical protein